MLSRALRLMLVSAAVGAWAATAFASAPVQIWPIDPKIEVGRDNSIIWLQNMGKDPAVMQVRVLEWDQIDGKDSYKAQTKVEVSPPLAQIAPGAKQLLRFTISGPRDAGEAAYRIIIDEIPARPKVEAVDQKIRSGVSLQMRYVLPLFVYGSKAHDLKPSLSCSFEHRATGRFLVIRNAGQRHVRLMDVRFEQGGQTEIVVKGLAGYSLAGKAVHLPWEANEQPVGQLRISGPLGADDYVVRSCA